MLERLTALITAIPDSFIGGFLTILGVIIGNKFSEKSSRKNLRFNLLTETFAKVFSYHLIYASDTSLENFRAFLHSIEVVSLICSPESEEILNKIVKEMSSEPPDLYAISTLINELHHTARKELRR